MQSTSLFTLLAFDQSGILYLFPFVLNAFIVLGIILLIAKVVVKYKENSERKYFFKENFEPYMKEFFKFLEIDNNAKNQIDLKKKGKERY